MTVLVLASDKHSFDTIVEIITSLMQKLALHISHLLSVTHELDGY